jgi:hypothetical protein
MPNDLVKISWLASLLRDDALDWFHARETKFKVNKMTDTWSQFVEAMEKRFTDGLELRKYVEKMRALKYDGSIDTYLSRLEEMNSRVGASGIMLRELVIEAMSPEIRRMVFSRHGRIPDEDDALFEVLRDAGQTLEEEKRTAEHYKKKSENINKNSVPESSRTKKGNQDAVPAGKGNQSGQKADPAKDKGKRPVKEATGAKKGEPKKDSLWKNGKEAFEGVPSEEINTHKKSGVDCWRCGRDTHRSFDCYARKTIAGTDLPIHPSKKTESVAATKRKQSSDEDKQPEPTQKKAKVAAIPDQDTAMEQARLWEEETDSEMDF